MAGTRSRSLCAFCDLLFKSITVFRIKSRARPKGDRAVFRLGRDQSFRQRPRLRNGHAIMPGIGGAGLDPLRGGHHGLTKSKGSRPRADDGEFMPSGYQGLTGGFRNGGLDLHVISREGALGKTAGFQGLLDAQAVIGYP